MSFDPTGKSVDQILDYGAPGLEYWEHFLPLYTKAFGAPRFSLTDVYARYDEQRGANLAEFDTARAELDKALTEAESRWSSHQSLAQALPAAWTGATGTEALTLMNSQLRQAREDLDTARTAATAISAALGPLHQAVLTKAEVALALLEPTADGTGRVAIDGKSPDDIDALVTDGTDPWLSTTFRPDVDRKLTTFAAACDTTAHTFESHYRTILTAFAQVIDHPYPQPAPTLLPRADPAPAPNLPAPQPLPVGTAERRSAQQPYTATWPTASESPGPAQSSGAGPAYSTPPVAQAATPDPIPGPSTDRAQPAAITPNPKADGVVSAEPAVSTEPAGTTDPVQPRTDQFATTLKDALTQFETGLQQGISAAVEKLGSLADQTPPTSDAPEAADDPESATEPKPAPDRQSGLSLPTGHLEFDLAGKHFVLERTPTGELTAAITDESGQTHTYKLTFDQNGNPTLAADPPNPTAPAAGDEAPAGGDESGRTPPAPADPAGASGGAPSDPPPGADQPGCTPDAMPDPCPEQGSREAPHPAPAAPGPATDPGTADAPPGWDSKVCPDPCPTDGSITPAQPPSTCAVPPPEYGAPQPPLDNPVPPAVSPPADADDRPPPPADSVPPSTPQPNTAPPLGSPDAPLEIPDGGIEIPEISPHAQPTGP
ncbi:hypothetical protein [Nocardia concava]|uniref:hypothetical protein n=1 Tax=Nocardia concava TaxID=257281 RepID=UPI0002F9AB5F|nr:hypothetical protein [Nocardia concava]